MTLLVTGGAGFIGSNFVRDWVLENRGPLVNLDKLTYAGNLDNLSDVEGRDGYEFVHGDIADRDLVSGLLKRHAVRAIVNFAAESHVDRSILGPEAFIVTNVLGTFRLLEAARDYRLGLDGEQAQAFRFLHVSTDEVYGSLGDGDEPFSETRRYEPNSPYSASKASADHLVRAFHHTYGLPAVTTNCSNNYGPYQFPEKLLPLFIHKALAGEPLPVYGDGMQVRDWLHVDDHCAALRLVLEQGEVGEVYNVGGYGEMTNLDAIATLCAILDRVAPQQGGRPHSDAITFVTDRPGHDRRYAIDPSKITETLGWEPTVTFEEGLERTVRWYLDNAGWVERVTSGAYREWLERQYGS